MTQRQHETVSQRKTDGVQYSRGPRPEALAARSPAGSLDGIVTRNVDAFNPAALAARLNTVTQSRPARAGNSLLQLQQRFGNRYVQRVLSLARQQAGEAAVSPEVESVIEGQRGHGVELDHGVRRQMEPAFGSDFSGVRVHTGTEAHSLNRAVGAVAFTTGNDIFFSEGAYNPGNSTGKELLAHELTHVVQQGGAGPVSGRAQPSLVQRMCPACEEEKKGTRIQGKLVVGQANDQYEQEADRVAKAVTSKLDSHGSQQDSSRPLRRKCACGGETVSDRESRNPADEASGDDVYTQNGDGGMLADGGGGDGGMPALGGGATPMSGAPTPANKCSVSTGPSYSPSGTIPVVSSGGAKSAPFSFSAAFDTDASTGKKPSCCEVHQFIKWDTAFHTGNGGPPHSGFPSSAAANTWIEDRDQAGKRYGHRSDGFSDPIGGCGDEYKSGGTRDQANGDTYCGKDAPGGPSSLTGQWQFRLDAVDTCNGNSVKASSSVITINW